MDHDLLVESRNEEYDGAHVKTGEWMIENWDALRRLGSRVFDVCMVHNKLMRILGNPNKRDSYDDIIGYAKLALMLMPEYVSPPYFSPLPEPELEADADGRLRFVAGSIAEKAWELVNSGEATIIPEFDPTGKVLSLMLVPATGKSVSNGNAPVTGETTRL